MSDHPDYCPKCGIEWYSDINVYEEFINRGEVPLDAMDKAGMFGHTEDSPKYFSINVVGIEYRDRYDGVWEYKCQYCGHIEPRFK